MSFLDGLVRLLAARQINEAYHSGVYQGIELKTQAVEAAAKINNFKKRMATCENCKGEGLVGAGDQPHLKQGPLSTCSVCNGTGKTGEEAAPEAPAAPQEAPAAPQEAPEAPAA